MRRGIREMGLPTRQAVRAPLPARRSHVPSRPRAFVPTRPRNRTGWGRFELAPSLPPSPVLTELSQLDVTSARGLISAEQRTNPRNAGFANPLAAFRLKRLDEASTGHRSERRAARCAGRRVRGVCALRRVQTDRLAKARRGPEGSKCNLCEETRATAKRDEHRSAKIDRPIRPVSERPAWRARAGAAALLPAPRLSPGARAGRLARARAAPQAQRRASACTGG